MKTDPNLRRLIPKAASAASIDAKVQFLVDVHVWPERQRLNAPGWLKNFTAAERPFAYNLLNVFMYYNDLLVDALFVGAFRQLSATITASTRDIAQARRLWFTFLSRLLVSYVPGERPNITDSGILFARKARQVLGISEAQIVEPPTAVNALFSKPAPPILLVDDFVGSGQQTAVAWHRQYPVAAGHRASFLTAPTHRGSIYYTPLITTQSGLARITADCPGLEMLPSHVIGEAYSLTSPQSTLWPATLKPDAARVLEGASRRAGIVDALGSQWNGLDNLALPLAFCHGVPDATLPLYYWEENGWTPLVRRR